MYIYVYIVILCLCTVPEFQQPVNPSRVDSPAFSVTPPPCFKTPTSKVSTETWALFQVETSSFSNTGDPFQSPTSIYNNHHVHHAWKNTFAKMNRLNTWGKKLKLKSPQNT